MDFQFFVCIFLSKCAIKNDKQPETYNYALFLVTTNPNIGDHLSLYQMKIFAKDTLIRILEPKKCQKLRILFENTLLNTKFAYSDLLSKIVNVLCNYITETFFEFIENVDVYDIYKVELKQKFVENYVQNELWLKKLKGAKVIKHKKVCLDNLMRLYDIDPRLLLHRQMMHVTEKLYCILTTHYKEKIINEKKIAITLQNLILRKRAIKIMSVYKKDVKVSKLNFISIIYYEKPPCDIEENMKIIEAIKYTLIKNKVKNTIIIVDLFPIYSKRKAHSINLLIQLFEFYKYDVASYIKDLEDMKKMLPIDFELDHNITLISHFNLTPYELIDIVFDAVVEKYKVKTLKIRIELVVYAVLFFSCQIKKIILYYKIVFDLEKGENIDRLVFEIDNNVYSYIKSKFMQRLRISNDKIGNIFDSVKKKYTKQYEEKKAKKVRKF